jgi:fructose-1,6-bisphosphatase I
MAATLGDMLEERAPPGLAAALRALAEACAGLAARLARPGPLPDASAAVSRWLPGAGIRWVAVPGQGIAEVDTRGSLALAVDPLEGGAGALAGGQAGTVFSLRPAAATGAEASFLTPGSAILAAGAAVYGPRTRLALALEGQAAAFTLNPGTAGFEAEALPGMPADAPLIAADVGGIRHWDGPVRQYVEDCMAGADGPRGAAHSLAWSGCLAAELHRVLAKGGLFLAPYGAPSQPGLIHHAQPLAAIAEAAGGAATDGLKRLLDLEPRRMEAPSPLIFGAPAAVARLAAYHDLPDSEVSPLFGRRGLFRF